MVAGGLWMRQDIYSLILINVWRMMDFLSQMSPRANVFFYVFSADSVVSSM